MYQVLYIQLLYVVYMEWVVVVCMGEINVRDELSV